LAKQKPILTKKQEKFCKEYLVDFNGTRASIAAGYSPKAARSQGAQNLANINIQKRIKELQGKVDSKYEFTQEQFRNKVLAIINFDIRDILEIGEGGEVQYKPLDQWPEGASKLISEISEKSVIKESKDGKAISKYSKINAKIPDKIKALEQMARHRGWFNDKLKVDGELKITLVNEFDD
jgi:phage terminase small subunit